MRRTLPGFFWLLALLVALLPAAACREDGAIRIHSISFHGVTSVKLSQLKNALATREGMSVPVIGKLLPWTQTKTFFDRASFETDLERIKAFYADRGFPDAAVTSFDVKLNDAQTEVDVSLTITEGRPILVETLRLAGFEVLPPDRQIHLVGASGLEVGKPRDRQLVAAAREIAVNELRDQGYPYARVAVGETTSADGRQASITFTAEPGPLSHFGPIEIAGARSVTDAEIRRQLRIKPGDLYRRSLVQDSQRRLYGMALFQFVNIDLVDPENQDPDVHTRVTVAEGRHQRVNGGIGYGTDERARVEAEYHHLNFLGGGRSAGVHARASSLDRGVRFDFTQPYVFAPTLSAAAEGQRWYTYTPAYNSLVTGARVSLIERPSVRNTFTLSFSSERSTSTISTAVLNDPKLYIDLIAIGLDPTTGQQAGTLSAVSFDWQRTTANSVLDPTRGYQFLIHTEDAGHLLPGTFSYLAVAADARHYQSLSERVVIANRVQIGNINPANGDPAQVPFSKKFFLGGATSIRGWGRFEVSPLGGEGLPIGGNSLFAFSTEVRAQLIGKLGGVVFLDGGNVWADRGTIDLGDLRYATGLGVRYLTPVGPIRFDVGYQLNPIDGLIVNGEPEIRHWRLHFSIGQAF